MGDASKSGKKRKREAEGDDDGDDGGEDDWNEDEAEDEDVSMDGSDISDLGEDDDDDVETHQLGIWNKEVVRFLVVLLNGMVSKLFHLSFPASGNFSPSPSAWSTLNRTRPTAVDSCRLCDHQITGRGT